MNSHLVSITVIATLTGQLWAGGAASTETKFTLSARDWSGQLHGSITKLRESVGQMHRNGDFQGTPEVSELCLRYAYRRGGHVHSVTVYH